MSNCLPCVFKLRFTSVLRHIYHIHSGSAFFLWQSVRVFWPSSVPWFLLCLFLCLFCMLGWIDYSCAELQLRLWTFTSPLTLWSSSLNTWRFLFCRCHWILCPAHSCVKVRGSVFHSLFFFSIRVRVQKTFNLNNPKIYFLYVNVITNEDNMVIVILVPHI